jgi:cysteine synthase A
MGGVRWDARDTKAATRNGPSDGVASPPPRSLRAGVLTAVGNTPIVRLERLFPGARFDLYAKLEALNPGGSIKDRPAFAILEDAIRTGRVREGTVVIESSSGNFAVGLAQVCA